MAHAHKYPQVGIEQLSRPQINKLLAGERVKIKIGQNHNIHITHEHHKRLHKAHQKGAGIMVELDPYACDLNQHLHGEGLGKHLKHAVHKAGHFVKQHKEHFRPLASHLKEAGHQAVADASMYALENGVDPSLVGAYGQMAHEAIQPVAGGSFKSFIRSPGMKVVRKALRPLGQTLLTDSLGLASQGLAQGMTAAQSGMASGMGFLGMGVHRKAPVRKAPAGRKAVKKGSALFPAGQYGSGFGPF